MTLNKEAHIPETDTVGRVRPTNFFLFRARLSRASFLMIKKSPKFQIEQKKTYFRISPVQFFRFSIFRFLPFAPTYSK